MVSVSLGTDGSDLEGSAARPVLACRRFGEADIEPAVVLLTAGFPARDPCYWRRALDRLRHRHVPEGRPRYGHVLTDRGRLVGILLLIFAEADDGSCRANVSSWYVEPHYRGFSHLLLSSALKLRDVTLFNISPDSTTFDTVKAQGFVPYVEGTSFVLAMLGRPVPDVHVLRVDVSTPDAGGILVDHALWGCLCFEVVEAGTRHPFIFMPTRFSRAAVPCAQLVYCPSIATFVRFAGPLGRHLARHGLPVVALDASGPVPGLPSLHRKQRGRRIYRGAVPPRVGDLAYTELAIFGP